MKMRRQPQATAKNREQMDIMEFLSEHNYGDNQGNEKGSVQDAPRTAELPECAEKEECLQPLDLVWTLQHSHDEVSDTSCPDTDAHGKSGKGTDGDSKDVACYPLSTPDIAGPGDDNMSVQLALASQASSTSTASVNIAADAGSVGTEDATQSQTPKETAMPVRNIRKLSAWSRIEINTDIHKETKMIYGLSAISSTIHFMSNSAFHKSSAFMFNSKFPRTLSKNSYTKGLIDTENLSLAGFIIVMTTDRPIAPIYLP